jgi:hypothetical protein
LGCVTLPSSLGLPRPAAWMLQHSLCSQGAVAVPPRRKLAPWSRQIWGPIPVISGGVAPLRLRKRWPVHCVWPPSPDPALYVAASTLPRIALVESLGKPTWFGTPPSLTFPFPLVIYWPLAVQSIKRPKRPTALIDITPSKPATHHICFLNYSYAL